MKLLSQIVAFSPHFKDFFFKIKDQDVMYALNVFVKAISESSCKCFVEPSIYLICDLLRVVSYLYKITVFLIYSVVFFIYI